LYLHSLFYNQK